MLPTSLPLPNETLPPLPLDNLDPLSPLDTAFLDEQPSYRSQRTPPPALDLSLVDNNPLTGTKMVPSPPKLVRSASRALSWETLPPFDADGELDEQPKPKRRKTTKKNSIAHPRKLPTELMDARMNAACPVTVKKEEAAPSATTVTTKGPTPPGLRRWIAHVKQFRIDNPDLVKGKSCSEVSKLAKETYVGRAKCTKCGK